MIESQQNWSGVLPHLALHMHVNFFRDCLQEPIETIKNNYSIISLQLIWLIFVQDEYIELTFFHGSKMISKFFNVDFYLKWTNEADKQFYFSSRLHRSSFIISRLFNGTVKGNSFLLPIIVITIQVPSNPLKKRNSELITKR